MEKEVKVNIESILQLVEVCEVEITVNCSMPLLSKG